MLASYGYIAIFLAISLIFPMMPLIIARYVSPRKPDPIKISTYECGVATVGRTWVQFNVRYYLYALIFVIFDIETIFLYPWAVAFRQLGLYAFVEMLVFVAILVVGFVYAWKKKALEWS
ncbi:MAG: NADH-quinone oxidoreductase subunit A [Dehalococcoidia bacterium]|nr:NADH-quinone oxidoreductase subunit A [Dehalococcoidia bacterium]